RGEGHGRLGHLERHALQLEHHATGLHHGHPPVRRALTLTHAGLGGLLRDRLVREDPDPHLTATLDVTRERHTSGLDLPVGNPAGLQRLQRVVAEGNLAATVGDPRGATLESLAELYPLRTEH